VTLDSKDRRIQRKCSSGGVTFEICAMLIEEGYKVCAVKYNVEKEYDNYLSKYHNQYIYFDPLYEVLIIPWNSIPF